MTGRVTNWSFSYSKGMQIIPGSGIVREQLQSKQSPFLKAFQTILIALMRSRSRLIQKPLKAGKDLADLFGPSKVGHGVGNRVVIFETK